MKAVNLSSDLSWLICQDCGYVCVRTKFCIVATYPFTILGSPVSIGGFLGE